MDLAKGDIVSAFCEELQTYLKGEVVTSRQTAKGQQVYVHFFKQDKRLDKWYDIDQLEKTDLDSEELKESKLNSYSQFGAAYEDFEKLHDQVTKIRNIDLVTIGKYTIKTWYYSPYPDEFNQLDHIFVCDKCFRYFKTQEELDSHMQGERPYPPGKEIYRNENISIFELKGNSQKLSCQCLCLLSKLFLDHKTLYYDVEGFNLYVLCELDDDDQVHIAGYFSKELDSSDNNILACITILPPYQKRGYGFLLISLAYEIARREGKVGGPERPLSDLGKIAFSSYWREVIISTLKDKLTEIKYISDIVKLTYIDEDDVVDTLKPLNLVESYRGEYELLESKDDILNIIDKIPTKRMIYAVDAKKLIWLPSELIHPNSQ